MNNPVNFEIIEVLRSKDFNLLPYLQIDDSNPKNLNSNYSPREYQPWYYTLTIAEVIMWLYETHEIWISVDRHFDKFISKNNGVLITFYGNRKSYFDTPTEAYEAAIEYCLTKIKLK